MHVVKKQMLDGRRLYEPKFTAVEVTTFGELGPGCAVVQEWLAMRYHAHLLNMGQRPDGLSAKIIVGQFRADFRLALMIVAARRSALMQLGAGLPASCVRGAPVLFASTSRPSWAMAHCVLMCFCM